MNSDQHKTERTTNGSGMSDRVTVHFDHHHLEDRDAAYVRLRDSNPPVVYTDCHGGYWIVLGYEEAKRVMSDPRTFSSARSHDGGGGVTIPPSGISLSVNEMDPPLHTTYRRALMPMFRRTAVTKMRPIITRIVDSCLDRIVDAGEFDLVRDLCDVVPKQVMTEWFGLPIPQERLTLYIEAFLQSVVDRSKANGSTLMQMDSELQSFIDQRRRIPDSGLLSYLLSLDDPKLTDREVLELTRHLLVGGFETTKSLIAMSLVLLCQHLPLRQRLIEDPSLKRPATEEFLRYSPPGGGHARTVTEDVELGGQLLRKGDRVFLAMVAACRDHRVYEAPDEINIERGAPHLGFGSGIHFCLGAWLARLENNVVIERVLSRIPNYVVDLDRGKAILEVGLTTAWTTLPAATGLARSLGGR